MVLDVLQKEDDCEQCLTQNVFLSSFFSTPEQIALEEIVG